jgi:hypothetical protein
MRITAPNPFAFTPPATAVGRTGSKAAPETFAPTSDPTASAVSTHTIRSAAGARGTFSVDMLMTIAGGGEDREHRKRLVKDADEGLGHLESLHTEALQGNRNPSALKGLTSWLSEQGEHSDPSVQALMREISLRAQVELAKHSVEAAGLGS